jgi:serine-type D-Ala-D-Ala carboxypeptidase/endopeptidase (penicillin-binding protein 4)
VRRGDPDHQHRHRHGRRSGGTGLVLVLSVVLLLAAGGYAAYDAGWLDRYLGTPDRVAPAAIPPPEGVEVPPAPPARPVLDPATAAASTAQPVTPRELRAHLGASLRDDDFGRHLGVLVERLGTDQELLRVGGHERFIPASSTKLLTTTTALELMGPDHRFHTTVVGGRGPGERHRVVLVGGGDPLLTQRPPPEGSAYPEPATLRDLARQTADRLKADGVGRVRLGYDASLFTGPAASPQWERDYVPGDVVSPISALWVDEGRDAAGLAARSDDPAAAAAEAFAAELERAGISVRGTPTQTPAPTRSRALASVPSPPLSQIVQYVLENSDNEGAEVLLRQAGLASGHAGSFDGGTAAVQHTLSGLGVDMSRTRLYDGSGLSRPDRLTLDTLVDTLQVAAAPDQPDLRSVVTGLPVAGFNGSLAYRFVTFGQEGRGLVRAKTGTLSGVNALAGVTVDRDGTPLVFAAVADRVRLIDTLDARAALDVLTADLASCC